MSEGPKATNSRSHVQKGVGKNVNSPSSQPRVDCQMIPQSELNQRLEVPDRTLQLTQNQINVFVQSGSIHDVNTNPQILNAYREPSPSHARKIAFTITNLIVLIKLLAILKMKPEDEMQAQIRSYNLFWLGIYFLVSLLNISINLIFHYAIKPERIMKKAHHFLLLNVHPMNTCLNVFFGYLISDFGFLFLPIGLILLAVNSINIWKQNRETSEKLKLIGRKNKLLGQHSQIIQDQMNQITIKSSDMEMTNQMEEK